MFRQLIWCIAILFVTESFAVVPDEPIKDRATDSAKDEKPAVKVDLRVADWKAVKKYVAENKGKVVVVDIWSTSCLPCMKEFPKLVALKEKHKKQIVCVGVNIDYVGIKSKPPEYYRPRVEKFLASRKAGFRNYMSSVEAIEMLDELKLNSIPAVYVFDKNGKLAKRFDDTMLKEGAEEAFNYKDDINPLIEKLLK